MNATAIDITRLVAAQHQADIRRHAREAALARQATRGAEDAGTIRAPRSFAWRRFVPVVRVAR